MTPNVALQWTRRLRIRSGRSLRSLGSPLNDRPLGLARLLTISAAFTLLLAYAPVQADVGIPEVVPPKYYPLTELLRRADLVAFVRVRSGDVDPHTRSTYQALVLDSVKGAVRNDLICFSTRSPDRLETGGEYVVFLARATGSEEWSGRLPAYRQAEKFWEPWEVEVTKEVAQLCAEENCPLGDVALRLDQNKDLPEFAVTYPASGSDGVRWIRRSQLLHALRFQLSRALE